MTYYIIYLSGQSVAIEGHKTKKAMKKAVQWRRDHYPKKWFIVIKGKKVLERYKKK